jgi:hypothetical protein
MFEDKYGGAVDLLEIMYKLGSKVVNPAKDSDFDSLRKSELGFGLSDLLFLLMQKFKDKPADVRRKASPLNSLSPYDVNERTVLEYLNSNGVEITEEKLNFQFNELKNAKLIRSAYEMDSNAVVEIVFNGDSFYPTFDNSSEFYENFNKFKSPQMPADLFVNFRDYKYQGTFELD